MNIEITFTLSSGGKYQQITSDFATLDACQQEIAGLLRQETGSITFSQPNGSLTAVAIRHVVGVDIAPDGGA
jgi:hypothetical protein